MTRNSTKTITIQHYFTTEERAEWSRIGTERRMLDQDEKVLIQKIKDDPEAKLAAKIAGYGTPPEVTLSQTGAVLKFSIIEKIVEDDKPQTPAPKPPHRPAPVYVDPKTLNALLHGKLLTDAEKRKLVAQVLPEGVLADEATS